MSGGRWRAAALSILLAAAPAAAVAAAAADTRDTGLPSPSPSAWRFAPAVAFAYDSFGQRYSVTDDDTLDLVDEWSTRVHARVERTGRTRFELQNDFAWGEEALRNALALGLVRPVGRNVELRLRQELRATDHAQQSDDTFASDSWVGTTRAAVVWRLPRGFRLRADDRFEWATFEPADRYNYRYRLHDAGGEIEQRWGFLSSWRLGWAWGARSVPDSSAIDYRRHVGRFELRHELGAHALGLDQRVERRRYGDIRARSHFWESVTDAEAQLALHPRLRLRPRGRAEWTDYDRPDSLWSDAREQAIELVLEGDAGPAVVVGLGPRAQFRRTAGGVDRSYNQWSAVGRVTVALGATLWLQFQDEIGVREHLAGDDLLYTDYVFNSATLVLAWQARPRLALDLFASFDPQNHSDPLDDTTTLLFSSAVTWGLR